MILFRDNQRLHVGSSSTSEFLVSFFLEISRICFCLTQTCIWEDRPMLLVELCKPDQTGAHIRGVLKTQRLC
jgi:hypothetical protein